MVHAGEPALLTVCSDSGLSCQANVVIPGGVVANCKQQANTPPMLVAAALAGLDTHFAPSNPSVVVLPADDWVPSLAVKGGLWAAHFTFTSQLT